MSFTETDYALVAARLRWPIPHVKAFSDVEAAGETFWLIDGQRLVPVRLEAHWFGKLTNYRFNNLRPDLSSYEWNPALAATTRAGAWQQVRAAMALDKAAGEGASSWGPFQIMGFNWSREHFRSVDELVGAMQTEYGQLDSFARFIEGDAALQEAGRVGDWATAARLYNGEGNVAVYAGRLKEAVARHADGYMPVPRPLHKGDYGLDVRALQIALNVTPADSSFGPATEAAVRIFQAHNHLVVDGIAGAMTKGLLRAPQQLGLTL